MDTPTLETAPEWLLQETASLAAIDRAFDRPASKPTTWSPKSSHADALYCRMTEMLSSPPEVIVLAPWLKPGGADLGTLHHLKLCRNLGRNALLITTTPEESPWINRTPPGVDVIEMGRLAKSMCVDPDDTRLVLARFLMQSSAATIHNINSELGWQVMARYGRPLKTMAKKLFVSLFSDDIGPLGESVSYAGEPFLQSAEFIDGVFTDSDSFRQKLLFRSGFPDDRVRTLYFPVDQAPVPVCRSDPEANRVLWASRITSSKIPEIVVEIARRMPEITFDVYGEIDSHLATRVVAGLKQTRNISLCGAYFSFAEIASLKPYSLFLYTSNQDGMPNVVLEALACGLPVVAPDVGGISEVLGLGDGARPLATDCYDPEAFVARIREVISEPEVGPRWWRSGTHNLGIHHTWNAFASSVSNCRAYFV